MNFFSTPVFFVFVAIAYDFGSRYKECEFVTVCFLNKYCLPLAIHKWTKLFLDRFCVDRIALRE